MTISKHIHSCLLVEDQNKTILIDPGNYSYDAKALDVNTLKQLDAIVITHEHPDHMYIPWIKEIIQKFPNTPIFTTNNAKQLLEQENIENINTKGNEFISLEPVPHEKIWMGKAPENVMATLFGKFVTPGDSHSFNLNRHPEHSEGSHEVVDQVSNDVILALPVQAPWGSTTRAVELALELKPKIIIPIHDWHWRDEARKSFYQRLKEYFAQNGIDFKAVETGEIMEV
ncbi:MAG TPA: MBL fold metallo-hydrolase [Patescibacteria group bacterium]